MVIILQLYLLIVTVYGIVWYIINILTHINIHWESKQSDHQLSISYIMKEELMEGVGGGDDIDTDKRYR